MAIKPSLEDAQRRLRVDDALAADLTLALDQALAEAETYLDGKLFESAAAKAAAIAAATDDAVKAALARGIVVTPDIQNAMLLLADVYMGNNDSKESERKQAAAINILRRHRNKGA